MRRRHHISASSITSIKSKSSTGTSYMKPIKKVRRTQEIEEFKKEIDIDDHMVPMVQLLDRLQADPEMGLSQAKADELLVAMGPNCLVASVKKSKWIILAGYLFGGFNALLWAGCILTCIGYTVSYFQNPEEAEMESIYFATLLFLVIMFTGFFGFYQESTNQSIMESFSKMVPQYATVIRDGQKIIIPSEELVIGDLVEVHAGSMVPADIRIIESQMMKVDNSAITGESFPISKGPECTSADPLETMNLAFYTTLVVEGEGTGIVIRCGENTVVGRIAGLATSLEKKETLIHREIRLFVKIITILAIIIGIIFFSLSMAIGYDFFKSFTFFIAIMVANVPEGLPVTLTASMTLTAKRMATKNCLVKKVACIETLGACNVICSDKTGTLTQNIMTVAHMFYDGRDHDVLQSSSDIDRNSKAYRALCNIAILCSRAYFVDPNNVPLAERQTVGDASETAILKIMEKLEGNIEEIREEYPKICEIPFSSVNKYQVSIHHLGNEKNLLVMKGAPERVLERCSTCLSANEVTPMSPEILNHIHKCILRLGIKGERVLAFADLELPKMYDGNYPFNVDKINFPLRGLRFVGLISLIDPPRPSVPEALRTCKSAGIRVIMVTGDHPITATAIAKKIGLISPTAVTQYDIALRKDTSITLLTEREKAESTAAVITGTQLKEMSATDLQNILITFNEIVFARTSPQQKLKIVEALQKLDMVVAVTGDGVNDSPAMKEADIGIAMGISGSDVAKESADMILLDDNFSSIVTGIEEGRLIFDNLKKSIAFVLTSNVPEIVPFMMLVALNIPEALSVMAIIVIDVATDLWPAISLAYEKPEADIMNRRPRNPKTDKLINHRMIYVTYAQIGFIQACASFACYFCIMAMHGFRWDRLIGIRAEWESRYINDLRDSNGLEWTYYERTILTKKCISAYYLGMVLTQVADLLVCKTRRLSIFQQGMKNHVLTSSLIFALIVAALVVYCPGVNTIFQFEPIYIVAIVPAIPFAIIIFVYDEIRKFIIRKYPEGFIYQETYY